MSFRPRDLTLIVATTRSGGIGRNGSLPWTGLRKEMSWFARVTKRVIPPESGKVNAIIMGQKTWKSIPVRFQPLASRVNIIITRLALPPVIPDVLDVGRPVYAPSLDTALEYLRVLDGRVGKSGSSGGIGKVFVIGGGMLYAEAVRMGAARCVVTVVKNEFDCDTEFPVVVGKGGWERKEQRELSEVVGEEVEEGDVEENGVKYEFQLWEKQSDEAEKT